jgi:uncharacterized integral membrane protein (TIGR00698 family)
MKKKLPGWSLMLVVALASKFFESLIILGSKNPLEAITIAIILGLFLRVVEAIPEKCEAGITKFETPLIWGIVFLGAGLTTEIARNESKALIILIITMFSSFFIIYFIGKLVKLPERLRVLLAVGLTICGGTAVAITGPLIESKEEETGYAIGTITIWGLIAIFLYPFLGKLWNLNELVFGIWAATAIPNTPQVIGTAYVYSFKSGQIATMVKLTRNVFMIPLAFLIAIRYIKKKFNSEKGEKIKKTKILKTFPWFLFGYVIFAILRNIGFFTPS